MCVSLQLVVTESDCMTEFNCASDCFLWLYSMESKRSGENTEPGYREIFLPVARTRRVLIQDTGRAKRTGKSFLNFISYQLHYRICRFSNK